MSAPFDLLKSCPWRCVREPTLAPRSSAHNAAVAVSFQIRRNSLNVFISSFTFHPAAAGCANVELNEVLNGVGAALWKQPPGRLCSAGEQIGPRLFPPAGTCLRHTLRHGWRRGTWFTGVDTLTCGRTLPSWTTLVHSNTAQVIGRRDCKGLPKCCS